MTDKAEQKPVPAGYLEDAQGRLVPLHMVRPVDLQRDEMVRDLAAKVKRVSADLARTKADLLDDVSAHIALTAERYGVRITGDGQNVVLMSYDGLLKIERSTSDRIVVGEEVHAAQELAAQHRVPPIYVQHESILVRPFFPGAAPRLI
jgi:hypothetical protein